MRHGFWTGTRLFIHELGSALLTNITITDITWHFRHLLYFVALVEADCT
jgi:hypothetical protein